MAPDECLNCGAEVPLKARACSECGACENTGWSEASEYDSSRFVEDEFQYDDFIELYSYIQYPCAITSHFGYLEQPKKFPNFPVRFLILPSLQTGQSDVGSFWSFSSSFIVALQAGNLLQPRKKPFFPFRLTIKPS